MVHVMNRGARHLQNAGPAQGAYGGKALVNMPRLISVFLNQGQPRRQHRHQRLHTSLLRTPIFLQLESQARGWIEACIGEELGPGSFHDVLKSGVALCSLVRVIQPDIIKAPSKLAAPFKQMENIGNYLSACTKLGVSAHDSFQTVDLFEGKNMRVVAQNLHALARVARYVEVYSGPLLPDIMERVQI